MKIKRSITAALVLIASLILSPGLAQAVVQDGDTVSGTQDFSIPINYDPSENYPGVFWVLEQICVYVDDAAIDSYQKTITISGNTDPIIDSVDLSPKNGCSSRSNDMSFGEIDGFASIDFKLNTALLQNGNHEITVYMYDSEDNQAPYLLDFTVSNTKFAAPLLYFNEEIFNCYDCMAIGVPYLLSWTFGTSAYGNPTEVSSSLKVNNKWGSWIKAGRANGKYTAKFTLKGDTWIQVRAKWGGKYYYYKQLLKPGYTFVITSPESVRVGSTGRAKVRLPGVSSGRCVITERFYGDYGHSTTKKWGANLYGGSLTIATSHQYSGTVDGDVECKVPGDVITGSWGWDVSFW